jgi:hypothetical protein
VSASILPGAVSDHSRWSCVDVHRQDGRCGPFGAGRSQASVAPDRTPVGMMDRSCGREDTYKGGRLGRNGRFSWRESRFAPFAPYVPVFALRDNALPTARPNTRRETASARTSLRPFPGKEAGTCSSKREAATGWTFLPVQVQEAFLSRC